MKTTRDLFIETSDANVTALKFIAEYIDNTSDVGLYSLLNVPKELKSFLNVLMPKYKVIASDYDELLKRFPEKQELLRNYKFMCDQDTDCFAQRLLRHDIFEYLITVDKVIEDALISKKQALNLNFDSDALVLVDDELVLLPQGITYQGQLLFYSQFLRRHYTSNYTEITSILKRISQVKELKLYIGIDEYRLSVAENYRNIIELDYHFGKPFVRGLLDIKDHKGVLVHTRSANNEHLNVTMPLNRVEVTFNQHGASKKSVEIEEVIPTLEEEVENVGRYNKFPSNKYRINRHIHFEYNQDTKNVEHLDASVKIYPNSEYTKRFLDVGNKEKDGFPKRIKLFRIDGEIEYDVFQEILVNYFYYNELVSEIFVEKSS